MKSLAILVVFIFICNAIAVGVNEINKDIKDEAKIKSTNKIKNKIKTDTKKYDLLILCPSIFYEPLYALKLHKEKYGIKTIIVTLDEIYHSKYFPCKGRDNAEMVKYFIKNAYDNWHIKYVLLVGGRKPGKAERWYMPVRYVYNQDVDGFWSEPRFLSDLYFADIYDSDGKFSSWDTNGNGIYGEWIGEKAQDIIDLYPDVYVGRWPARNAFEVEIMVEKTIEYEKNAYGKEWFKRIVVAAGDTYPEYPGYEGEETTSQAMQYMQGFEIIRLYTSEGTLNSWKDIVAEVNKGCGFLYLDGHGNPMSWTTHLPRNEEWIDDFDVFKMIHLKNKGKYPICIVGGCHNSQFNVTIFNSFSWKHIYKGENSPECWSWWITRKINGGAIATIGCTALGYTKEDKSTWDGATTWLEPRFFWEYGINGTDVLGEVWGKAIIAYLNKYKIDWNTPAGWDYSIDAKTVQEWCLFGDPSLKIGGYS